MRYASLGSRRWSTGDGKMSSFIYIDNNALVVSDTSVIYQYFISISCAYLRIMLEIHASFASSVR